MQPTIPLLIIGLLTATVLFGAAPVAAQDEVSLTVEVSEDSSACGEDRTWCFEVTEGDLADITAGAEVTITFRNTGGSPHQLDVTTLDQAHADHSNTQHDAAIANTTSSMPSGAEDTITFTAPDDADGLYFWCGVSGHEQLGMWFEAPYGGAGDDEEGGAGEAPAPGAIALLAALGLAFVAFRRRD